MLNIDQRSDNFTVPIALTERALRLGLIREGSRILDPDAMQAAARLRADKYIRELGWLSSDDIDADGGESDAYDDHATHFAVLAPDHEVGDQAVATVRFVQRPDGQVPMRSLFPEVGRFGPICEVSRYIARDRIASLALRAVMVAQLLERRATGVAMVSQDLADHLNDQGLANQSFAGPRAAEAYDDEEQVAIALDAASTATDERYRGLVQLARRHDWGGLMQEAARV
ncbi:MAG: hypothetical protein AAF567_09215 [Actinomycetota bacterium]